MIKKYDLSGVWKFALDAKKSGAAALSDTITLPSTTAQAKKGEPSSDRATGYLTEEYPFCGWTWYGREIRLSPDDVGKPLLLTLERTRISTVWVNDAEIGTNDSLNSPHRYELTADSQALSLIVRVSNTDYPTRGGHMTSPDTQTNWNGILGEISLAVFDSVHIEDLQAYPDIRGKSVMLRGHLVGADSCCAELSAEEISLEETASFSLPESDFNIASDNGGEFSLTVPLGENAVLWSENTPVFYSLKLCICGSGECAEVRFGLREFTAEAHEFCINGKPTFLRGKHDGMIFPLSGAAPTDVDGWLRVMKISKSYGINHYRFHTCCPPDAAFTAADLLGIYMQPELPFWGTLAAPGEEQYNALEQEYLVAEGFRLMKAFGNHPSFCMMSLGNELWGSSARMAEIIRGYKAVDRRRLYTEGSNNFQFWPVILDEDDFFSGVRFGKNRLIRGSYAMCDAPLGHIQTDEPSTRRSYDGAIIPAVVGEGGEGGDIEIQFGTGVKKVKMDASSEGIIPDKPVVSHEIGQYAVFPNFKEIEKYTGVLKARNFEIFRERLDEKGMLRQSDDFFIASGKLSVQCYKEELEAAMRSELIAGYQLLDIQDFSGQGTALVGILDAFMDNKGLVTRDEWRGFCSDAVLLALFDRYNYTAGDVFEADIKLRCYREGFGGQMRWSLTDGKETISSGTLEIPQNALRLVSLGSISVKLPDVSEARTLTFTLSADGTANSYKIYLYPDVEPFGTISCAYSLADALKRLENGENVLFLPKTAKNSIEGFYCTDFWCYPMFRSISESMNRPVPVGTMGLLVDKKSPAVSGFTQEIYSTPQWYGIVTHADCAVLDDFPQIRPIVQMIDNFERNHCLGILFEARVGSGKLLVCTSRLDEISEKPEVRSFLSGLCGYVNSEAFNPSAVLTAEQLETLF